MISIPVQIGAEISEEELGLIVANLDAEQQSKFFNALTKRWYNFGYEKSDVKIKEMILGLSVVSKVWFKRVVMKTLIIICLLLLVGCDNLSGKAWYNPESSIAQAMRDVEECEYISYTSGWFNQYDKNILTECLKFRGYELHEISQLKNVMIRPNVFNTALSFKFQIAGNNYGR